jgi:uncharacterized protein YdaU (DUF1376 family)
MTLKTGEFWFPWYPDLYAQDTLHLTPYQDGIYRRLIDHYMKTAKPIPENMHAILRVTGAECYEHATSMLQAYFEHTPSIGYTHKKCDILLRNMAQRAQKRTNKASQAAKTRWQNNDINHMDLCYEHSSSNATSIHQAMLGNAKYKEEYKKEERKKDLRKEERKKNNKKKEIQPNHDFEEFWITYPKNNGTKKSSLDRYEKLVASGIEIAMILEGAKNYADHVRTNSIECRFTKHASSWLNQHGWTANYGSDTGSPEKHFQAKATRGFASAAEALAAKYEALADAEESTQAGNEFYFAREIAPVENDWSGDGSAENLRQISGRSGNNCGGLLPVLANFFDD